MNVTGRVPFGNHKLRQQPESTDEEPAGNGGEIAGTEKYPPNPISTMSTTVQQAISQRSRAPTKRWHARRP
jgi:hypothetical protein